MAGLLLMGCSLLLMTQAPGAVLRGTVRDAASGSPVAGAVVELGDPPHTALTDREGRYLLTEVPAGSHLLAIRFMGYRPRTVNALVPSSGELEIDLSLDPLPVPLRTIEVWSQAERATGTRPTMDFADRTLTAGEIRSTVLLAEPDVLQALGGGEVVLDPESPNGVHVRGGASDQVGYTLDGIPVFNPYHAAGLFGGWNPDAIASVQASMSAPSSAGPDAASAVIAGVTSSPGSQVRTRGALSTGQARIAVDGPVGLGHAGFLIAARSAFPDAIAPDHEPDYLRGGARDWLIKLETPLPAGGLRVLLFDNQNRSTTARTTDRPIGTRNSLGWGSRSLGAEWWGVAPSAIIRLRAWHAAGTADAGWSALAGVIAMTSSRRDLGLQAEVELGTTGATTLTGIRVERRHTGYRVEADSGVGPRLGLDASTTITTLFAEHQRQIAKGLAARLGGSLTASAAGLRFGPRAQLHWWPRQDLLVSASVARLQQFTQSLRNPESVVGNIFPADLPVLAGRDHIPVARSDQADIGLDYRPAVGVHLGVRGYHRRFDGLVLVAATEGEPFLTAAPSTGGGTATGLSLDASIRTRRFGFMASYGLQGVRFSQARTSYVPQYGTTHLFNGGVIVAPRAGTTLRLGMSGGWGRHTTAVGSGLEWEACNLLDRGCEFGGSPHYQGQAVGGTLLPAYVRLDVGLRQEWRVTRGPRELSLALYCTYTNLLGRSNLLTLAPDAATGRPQGVEMRPSSPLVVGMDWRF
jgi:hypothetical protein